MRRARSVSLRQPNLRQHLHESRIVAQRIPDRLHLQPHQFATAILQCGLQVLNRPLAVAEPRTDHREMRGVDVAQIPQRFYLIEEYTQLVFSDQSFWAWAWASG